MRTTLSLDDDVLSAARHLAVSQHKSLGEIVSLLARQALQRVPSETGVRNGVPLLSVRADALPVTLDAVNRLRDELP